MPLLSLVATCMLAGEPVHSQPFTAADGDYFRLPGLAVTKSGVILAFAGKRKGGLGDFGHETDVVLRRSLDAGWNWEPEQTLATRPDADIHSGPVVIDRTAGRILKFCRYWPAAGEPQKVVGGTPYPEMVKLGWIDHVMVSDDEGVTWSEPEPVVMPYPKTATSAATGNGVHGVQLYDGRLLIQCGYVLDGVRYIGILYSDDHGAKWHLGATASIGDSIREFGMAVLRDGGIYINSRSHLEDHRRQVTFSEDRGQTFSAFQPDPALIEPKCHGAVAWHPGGYLLFSNPTSGRNKLMVRLSEDNGATWPHGQVLEDAAAAYSDLAVTPAGDVICLWERGEKDPYEALAFLRCSVAWLRQ